MLRKTTILQKLKRRWVIISIGVATLFGAPFIVPVFSPWSRINCKEYEIDLVGGQQRESRFFYWIPVHRRIEDTALSSALGEPPSDLGDPQWVHTNTFGPFTNRSPHHIFHSASHQILMLEGVWNRFAFDTKDRSKSSQELLNRWRSAGSDSIGDDYLNELTRNEEQQISPDR